MKPDFEGIVASASDIANSWARELGVAEIENVEELPKLIDRLWAITSSQLYRAQSIKN